VDEAVVVPAEEGEVVEVGGAAVEPVDEPVVGLAPDRRGVAAGEQASPVAFGERAALGGGGRAAGAAGVQGLAARPAEGVR
jgi:hypothetical protein